MHFLVVDVRYGTPIYVFLEADPHCDTDYPGLAVREVALEPVGTHAGRIAIGRDPNRPESFREFASDTAVTRAGFVLIEPRYVGPDWEGYCRHFRPEGEKPAKRHGRTPSVTRAG